MVIVPLGVYDGITIRECYVAPRLKYLPKALALNLVLDPTLKYLLVVLISSLLAFI